MTTRATIPFLVVVLPHDVAAQPAHRRLTVQSWPANHRAQVTIQSVDGQSKWRGKTPMTRKLAPGEYEVSVSLCKHSTWKQRLSLRRDRKLTACLDPDDQLVRCRHIIEVGGLKPKAVELTPDGCRSGWLCLSARPRCRSSNEGYRSVYGNLLHKVA
jgi:hypothetical protein